MMLRPLNAWTTVLGAVFAVGCFESPSADTQGLLGVPTGTATDIDGNVYDTIRIGKEEWLVQNLKTTTYTDGKPIPLVTDGATWANLLTDAYCWYDNDPANKDVYGALYNWNVIQTKKLCPTGWYVPSSDNWGPLADKLGGDQVAGGGMKETGTVHWQSPNSGATNHSGFTALPAGMRYMTGNFEMLGQKAAWWCEDEDDFPLPPSSWAASVSYNQTGSWTYTAQWPNGYSVRCMRGSD
jgi:uncharacterized protein (TIGR02145 family)